MTLGFFFFAISVECCLGILLSPLENNDNLKHVTKQFVAEWQWESWPIKQEPTVQDNQSPGPRINAALWQEPARLAWYLFGGQPVDSNITKVYSDIWKYSVMTRTWEKFFPHPSAIKNQNVGKKDGMMFFRSDLLDGITVESKKRSKIFKFFLCGGIAKINTTNSKKPDLWSTFYKRKKQEEEKKEELKFLAVYVPRTSKPSTVWQMDVKENTWAAYVCCCNATNNIEENVTSKFFKNVIHENVQGKGTLEKNCSIEKNITATDSESSIFDSKINKVEDEVDNNQQYLTIKNLNKKKKINQFKKGNESFPVKVKLRKKKSVDNVEKKSNETKSENVPGTDDFPTDKNKKEKFYMKLRGEQLNRKRKGDFVDKLKHSKLTTKYCSENLKGDEPVSWCEGKNGDLITADMSSSHVMLWVFNLWTSHWTKVEVKISDRVEWSLCSDLKTVRYAETGEEVYLFCTSKGKPSNTPTPSNDSTDSFGLLQKDNFIRKLVFRINYKEQILDNLGEIQLNSYFGTPEGEEVWQNTTKSTLRAIKTLENETILVLAYLGVVDLWILTEDSQANEYFDLTEKIWRGSALKWFDKYNAAFYNLQLVSESGKAETILIRNPRPVSVSEYWGRERGRFIIRIFRNENLKNQSFENRTREQNLTYELLRSDHKPSGVENQFSRTYSYFIFFGISLAIFKIFIFVIFVKRLVERSRQIKIRGECRKSPMIIRYSVIPDEMLQPVT